MKIFLIRHGETTGDIEDRYGGAYDDHLTDKGKEQLKETSEKLVNKGIEIIFSSTLIRAKESSEIINSKINCSIELIDGLQERSYGILGGLTKQEAVEKFPEAVEAHKDYSNTDPEGESLEYFKNRVIGTFEEITNKDYSTVAIVSHGGPIKQILEYLKKPIHEKVGDGEIIEIEV